MNLFYFKHFYIHSFIHLFIYVLWHEQMHGNHGICVEVRGQLEGADSHLPPCGFQGSNSGPRLGSRCLYFAEPSLQCAHKGSTSKVYPISPALRCLFETGSLLGPSSPCRPAGHEPHRSSCLCPQCWGNNSKPPCLAPPHGF